MRALSLLTLLFLLAPGPQQAPADPNGDGPKKESDRPPLDFKVFNTMDRPIVGAWRLAIPEAPPRRIDLKEQLPGDKRVLIGVDPESGEELLRVVRQKQGIGYRGQLTRVLSSCGLDTLNISEFLPLGNSIVMRFETSLTEIPCPPIDSGKAGSFEVVSRRGGPVRLRDLSDISSSSVRDTYSIGGDRGGAEASYSIPLGAVSLEPGSPVRFLRRVKSPLDGSLWFEIEAIVSGESGAAAPRGYVKSEAVHLIGSLDLERVPEN